MNLEQPTEENLKLLLDELGDRLKVANRSLLDHEDYDLEKYDDIKFMYDMVVQKGHLSASETQAFIDELRTVRKA
ncbi:DUF1128 domain-containing protein [Virgibacillus flavescens]|uniref:DUF1128 domain-containing protein n=1 Tax=Virgibacillus flavescens TaxID=1611422 RepID=UPI003D332EA8